MSRTTTRAGRLLTAALFAASTTLFAATPSPAPTASTAGADWPTAAHDPQGTRFSPLDQLNAGNVASLKLAFRFETGVQRGHEGAPLVVDGTMYIVTPYPNVVWALDLSKPGPAVKWKFDPHADPGSRGVACCDLVNRGAAFA